MSKISIDPDEFVNFTISFLLDKMIHDEETLPNNEVFNKLSDKMQKAGLRPIMMKMYMDMDANQRAKYKRIKKVFQEDVTGFYEISIKGSKETKTKPKGNLFKVKDTVKKVVRLLKQERKRTGFPVNEEKMDRIVEYVLKEQNKLEEE